jgi:hypothetical protein
MGVRRRKLHDPVAAAAPLPEISKVASAHRKVLGIAPARRVTSEQGLAKLNSQLRVRVNPEQHLFDSNLKFPGL